MLFISFTPGTIDKFPLQQQLKEKSTPAFSVQQSIKWK
jgi:hypothetical protein